MGDTPVVLRGVSVAGHAVSPLGRRATDGQASGGARLDARVESPPASVHDIHEAARERGYREGWAIGHKEATTAAREEVLAQGQALVAAAVDDARRTAQAKEAQRIEEAAHQRGLAQRQRIDALVASLPREITRRIEDAQDDIAALCMEVVVRLVGTSAARPQVVRETIVQALSQVRARPLVSIALNEADLAALRDLPDAEAWMQQQAPQAQWRARADIASGGCFIESPEGCLDARLDTQLQAFKRLLQEGREALRSEVRPEPSNGTPSP
jgi:flagellar assembly protein FliH